MELIVDEGVDGRVQDALYCEGNCQCCQYRWCASVTKERYGVLSTSAEPFPCTAAAAFDSLRPHTVGDIVPLEYHPMYSYPPQYTCPTDGLVYIPTITVNIV